MLKFHNFFLTLALCAGLFTLDAQAQEASLRVEGVADQPLVLSVADLHGLKRTSVDDTRTIKQGDASKQSTIHYSGVLLADVLERAGFSKLDPHTRRRSAVFGIAGDGYEAAYSWGEIFNSAAGERIIVIDEKDGQPLNAEDGPIAVASFADKNPSPRHVKRLLVLRVVQGVKP
jgi:hypothetical protein